MRQRLVPTDAPRSSAHRFLDECADLCLFDRSQFLQREGDRPQ